LSALFSEDIHAKRVYSLANATLGVISSASLAVSSIGQGLALARGRLPKHAIKQVDRLLSNPGIDVDEFSKRWVAHAVGPRSKIVVAMDWTDFDADNQATIVVSLVSRHGRSRGFMSLQPPAAGNGIFAGLPCQPPSLTFLRVEFGTCLAHR
jgi:hypothetical protein